MEIKCLVIGDPHFKISNTDVSEEMCRKTIMCADRMKPDFTVILGDILHNHGIIHEAPLNRALAWIEKMSEYSTTFLLIGNHDIINNEKFLSKGHAFNALKKWNNVYVIDHPESKLIRGKKFVFVPYVPPGRFKEALSFVKSWKKSTAIFAHQEFLNCKHGAFLSKKGDTWKKKYPLVISGHIHEYQKLQKNLIYVGTPFQHDFGSSPNKTISLFKFGQKYEQKRYDLDLRKLKTLKLNLDEITDFDFDQTDCNTRIIVSGDVTNISKLKQMHKLAKLSKLSSSVCYRFQSKILNTPTNFKNGLLESLASDDELITLFKELFD